MRWKWILGTVFFLIISLMAAVYVFLYTFDYNELKPRIAWMVKDATGRELNIDGEIDLVIGLSPALVVTDITFANASRGSQPNMIRVDKLQAQVRLLPLLTRNIDLRKIAFAGVEFLLETKAGGQGNWQFPADDSSTKSAEAFKPSEINADHIRFENFDLTYRDGKTGATTRFSLADLRVAKQAAGNRLTVDLKADYNGQPLTLAGQTGLVGELLGSKRFELELSGAFAEAAIKLKGAVDDVQKLKGVDLKLQASGNNLANLKLAKAIKLPKTTAFDLTGYLRGSKDAFALNGLSGTLAASNVNLEFSGNVGDLMALEGIDLQLKGSGKDLEAIGTIIDRKLPTMDEFMVEGRLTGSAKGLSLLAAKADAKRGHLNLAVNGKVQDIVAFSGVNLKVKGSGRDLAEIGAIIDRKLPATDVFEVQGRLTGSAKALSLQAARGSARRGSLNIALNGGVKNLLTLRGLDLQSKLTGRDLTEFGEIVGAQLPATDQFEVLGRLTGSVETMALQKASGKAKWGSVSLALKGEIMDVLALKSINVRLKTTGKELTAIGGPMVGSNLSKIGPFDISGHLIGSAKLLLLNDLTAIVDKSDFKGLAKIEFRKRPKITVRLESSVIDFTAIMRMAEKEKRELGKEKKRERRLFPEDPLPFDALKKVDADILMKARNIHAKDARLEFGHLTLKLQDGDFSIDRLEATYKQTKISGNLYINSSSPPQVATNFIVQGFDLGELLKETGVSDQVRANLDIAAHLKSRGDSVHSLMANLDGSIGAVMGEGYLTRYLDMLSVNLTQKVIHFWGKHKKGGEIRCAVVQFDVNSGTATSKAFVFDTEAGVLIGEGDINLGTEQLNFLLVPKPKGLGLSFSTKLRVSGSVMDPKVRPDTLSLLSKGARALSALVIGPLGLLAPFVHLGANKNHPCDVQSVGQLGLNIPAKK